MPNRNKLSEITKFNTTYDEGKELHSFVDYVERMKNDQKEIYFLAGEDIKTMLKSPLL